MRSRIWNSTLVEEFGSSASTVAIHARAHLELPEELDLHQEIWVDDTTVSTLWAYPDASILGEGHGLDTVPTWIIVVSVLVGLFVVSLIGEFDFPKKNSKKNWNKIGKKIGKKIEKKR